MGAKTRFENEFFDGKIGLAKLSFFSHLFHLYILE